MPSFTELRLVVTKWPSLHKHKLEMPASHSRNAQPAMFVTDVFTIDPTPKQRINWIIIINLSFTEGSFPSHFKSAHVSPLLKKPSLNKDSMKNYRPVSNLSFLSKVLEKVVVNQLNTHINSSYTSNQYQSAYRKFHSTETALLKIP